MDFIIIGLERVEWINVTLRLELLDAVNKLRFLWKVGNFLTSWATARISTKLLPWSFCTNFGYLSNLLLYIFIYLITYFFVANFKLLRNHWLFGKTKVLSRKYVHPGSMYIKLITKETTVCTLQHKCCRIKCHHQSASTVNSRKLSGYYMDHQISHSIHYFHPKEYFFFFVSYDCQKMWVFFSFSNQPSKPANQKANFRLLSVPAYGTHYGLWHWVLLRITGNLPTLIDFSVLARDQNVFALKIYATNGNMYSGGKRNLVVYIVVVWTHSGSITYPDNL